MLGRGGPAVKCFVVFCDQHTLWPRFIAEVKGALADAAQAVGRRLLLPDRK